MVGLRTVQYSGDGLAVDERNIPLLSIDYAQGPTDLNFVFFYASQQGRRNRQRLPVSSVKAACIKAAHQFPVLLGHFTRTSGEWSIVVDPHNINWPHITEARTSCTIALLRRSAFAWPHWPRETRMPDLVTRDSQPMLGVHIVRYACGGVSVHAKVRHMCMDGSGVWRFFQVWAAICRAERKRGVVPVVSGVDCRRVLANVSGRGGCREQLVHAEGRDQPIKSECKALVNFKDTDQLNAKDKELADMEAAEYMDGVRRFLADAACYDSHVASASRDGNKMVRFAMSQDSLDQLKLYHGKLAACSSRNMPYAHKHNISYVSTNDLVCALFWRAISRAHHDMYPTDPHTCMMLACDVRHRINIPRTYGGNASFPLLVHTTKDEMSQMSITDTAVRIRRYLNMVSSEFVRETLEFMASEAAQHELIQMFQPGRAFFSASVISKIPMFEMVDFGAGRPVHVDVPEYLTPGFSIWMPTRSVAQPVFVNLALTDSVFNVVRSDPEFRRFVDIS
ncbi:hypothetical protein IW147_002314 [Coemansia sp. RSA 720]|nr:hypothetical protein IW147_002314 [Coemansia sp. RSA 720]